MRRFSLNSIIYQTQHRDLPVSLGLGSGAILTEREGQREICALEAAHENHQQTIMSRFMVSTS